MSKGKPAPKPATLDDVLAAVKDLPAQVAKLIPTPAPAPEPAAPAVNPVYIVQHTPDSVVAYDGKPLLPANWMAQTHYNDRPTPRPDGPDRWAMTSVPIGNVARFARLAADGGTVPYWAGAGKFPDSQFFAGAMQAWDFEEGFAPANAPAFETFLSVARANAPGVRLGLTCLPWPDINYDNWAKGPTPDMLAKVRDGLAPYRRMVALCDYVPTGMYPGPPETIDRDCAAIRAINKFAAAEYGKPVICWIRPTHDAGKDAPDAGTELSPASAAKLWAAARETSDAVVIYSPLGWDVTRRVFGPLWAAKN